MPALRTSQDYETYIRHAYGRIGGQELIPQMMETAQGRTPEAASPRSSSIRCWCTAKGGA
jgi:hypothetical protein